jgi:hypothetical protein
VLVLLTQGLVLIQVLVLVHVRTQMQVLQLTLSLSLLPLHLPLPLPLLVLVHLQRLVSVQLQVQLMLEKNLAQVKMVMVLRQTGLLATATMTTALWPQAALIQQPTLTLTRALAGHGRVVLLQAMLLVPAQVMVPVVLWSPGLISSMVIAMRMLGMGPSQARPAPQPPEATGQQ